ncbi:MAG TPA: 4'-phosphopantetheinyl transferase superfamily protein [Bacteroidia bacterium]|nr:4'-phosphopantetheinyl transferase superfamily protein [Bacteroidia bacterium]
MPNVQLTRFHHPEYRFCELQQLPPLSAGDTMAVIIDALEFVPYSDQLYSVLNKKEQEKAERHIRPADRWIRIVSRSIARIILSYNIGCSPNELEIDVSEKGKPYLRKHSNWHFNVSHSAGLVLIYISSSNPVGCDVEEIKNSFDYSQIVHRFFSEKEKTRLTETNQHELFFRLWSEKEAFLKCIGSGVWESMNELDLSQGNISQLPASAESFRTAKFRIESCVGSGYAFSLCSFQNHQSTQTPFYRLIGWTNS